MTRQPLRIICVRIILFFYIHVHMSDGRVVDITGKK